MTQQEAMAAMNRHSIARRTELRLPAFDPALYRGTLTQAALMHNGNWLLLDETNSVLRRHGPGGKVLWETGNDELLYPRGVIALDEQSLVVLDSWKHRLVFFDIYLKQTDAVGAYGGGIDRFSTPAAMCRAPGGELLVCDTGNHRIKAVAPDGASRVVHKARSGVLFAGLPVQKPLFQWDDPPPLLYPQGIACNPFGELCVSAPRAGRLILFRQANGIAEEIRPAAENGKGMEKIILPMLSLKAKLMSDCALLSSL